LPKAHPCRLTRHAAACEQTTGIVLASTDVDGKTIEITRFRPLLDQLDDLRDTVITVDALHCQRDHATYLAERRADWILTVKGNQPSLYRQLAGLPWRAVPDATRADDRGHGRCEIRTLKILTIAAGIDFPHATQALKIRRRRRRVDQPRRFTTETAAWRRSGPEATGKVRAPPPGRQHRGATSASVCAAARSSGS
jgi:predicted transposase YbfD/YdcC